VLTGAAIIFVVTWRSAIPFDAAYNLLPYKNLVEFGRFEHRYGSPSRHSSRL
jgi:hypothetical protein